MAVTAGRLAHLVGPAVVVTANECHLTAAGVVAVRRPVATRPLVARAGISAPMVGVMPALGPPAPLVVSAVVAFTLPVLIHGMVTTDIVTDIVGQPRIVGVVAWRGKRTNATHDKSATQHQTRKTFHHRSYSSLNNRHGHPGSVAMNQR